MYHDPTNLPRRYLTTIRPGGRPMRGSKIGSKPARRRYQLLAVLATAVMLSACGSTVQWTGTLADGGINGVNRPTGPNGELAVAGPGDGTNAAGTTGAPGQNGVTDGNSTNRVTSGGTAASRPGLVAPPPGASGHGFTATEIYIGFGTYTAIDNTAGKAGYKGTYGDQVATANAVVKDMNARGGIAGRKIVLVTYDYTAQQQLQDREGGGQAACARWTQDRPVFAVINPVTIGQDTLTACLTKHQTPLIDIDSNSVRLQADFARYAPYLYAPAWMSMERMAAAWMQRLSAAGYFNGGWAADPTQAGTSPTKVGILADSTFHGDDFVRITKDALAKQGQSVAATYVGTYQDMSQAVLKFRQNGVTHVIPQVASDLLFFAQAAESQNYRPRYGMSSIDSPGGAPTNIPAQQLNGALGMGLIPTADVASAQDPGDVSGAQAACRKVLQGTGQDPANRGALGFALRTCDGFNFLATAVAKGGLSPVGIQRGAQAMGSMPPASTFGIALPNGRSDGASASRDLAYRNDCNCFVYTSGNNPM